MDCLVPSPLALGLFRTNQNWDDGSQHEGAVGAVSDTVKGAVAMVSTREASPGAKHVERLAGTTTAKTKSAHHPVMMGCREVGTLDHGKSPYFDASESSKQLGKKWLRYSSNVATFFNHLRQTLKNQQRNRNALHSSHKYSPLVLPEELFSYRGFSCIMVKYTLNAFNFNDRKITPTRSNPDTATFTAIDPL
jgi:hypothetical protein